MNEKSKQFLIFLVIVASIWQALGAILYMAILGDSPVAPWIFGVIKVIMISIPFIAIAIGWKSGTFFKGIKFLDVIMGIFLGIVLFVVIYGVFRFFPELFARALTDALPRAQTFGIATPTVFIMVGFLFSVFHSLFEEFYWRWFLFGAIRSFSKQKIAILLSGLAFSLHHIIILSAFTTPFLAIVFGLLVGVVGSFWCFLYERQGNIMSPWISHIAADFAIVFVGYLILF